MWILYQLAVGAFMTAIMPLMVLTRGPRYWTSYVRRLGLYGDGDGDGSRETNGEAPGETERAPLWLHAVSVGEVGVAATLAKALDGARLRPSRLLVTTVTPTGQERARASFPEADVTYLPFEIGPAVRRFFKRFAPGALILAEGDLWPVVLRHCKRERLPVVVVNGRVSDRSFRRMQRVRRWLGPIFQPVDHFAVQSDLDRERLEALGVEPGRITVAGNLKFETPEPRRLAELEDLLAGAAAGRPLLVAGSTMKGEDEAVLDAFSAAGGGNAALLVLAPRHPERWNDVADLLERRGFAAVRRSLLEAGSRRPEVVLLDSLGELASLYRLARGAFIGGTLVPTGGHNPLEAARFGTPVAVGPSMENFRDIAGLFDAGAAWRRVASSSDLGGAWSEWLTDPEEASALGRRGAELVERHRGAVARTVTAIRPFIARPYGEGGNDRGIEGVADGGGRDAR